MLFSGGPQYLMYRSTNGGTLWDESATGLKGAFFQTNDIAYDSRDGKLYAATSGGIYQSVDTGASWHRLSVGPDTLSPFNWLLINPHGPIIAATGNNDTNRGLIFVSTDAGTSWSDQSDGLSGSVSSLALDSSGRLYVGLSGARIYRSSQTTTGVAVNAEPTRLQASLAVRPNPSRGRVELRFTLAKGSRTSIHVVDLLGREVTRGFDGFLSGGEQRVEIDPGRLAGGIYLIRLEAGNASDTERLMIVP
jgi:photosystem II stability/assembly factor-like uncharacterized protein